jgi:hypothetical protein
MSYEDKYFETVDKIANVSTPPKDGLVLWQACHSEPFAYAQDKLREESGFALGRNHGLDQRGEARFFGRFDALPRNSLRMTRLGLFRKFHSTLYTLYAIRHTLYEL